MTEYFRARRIRSGSWSNQVLAQGELGFESNTGRCKIGDGVTQWQDLSYLDEGGGGPSPSTEPDRLEYGTTRLCQAGINVGGGFPGITNRMAPQLLYQYDEYKNCAWDIHEVNGPGRWTGQRFASGAALYTFLNANVTQSGGVSTYNVMGTWYDEIDQSLPKINKIYGMNQFYSILKGRRAYKNSAVYCMNTDYNKGTYCKWSNFPTFFAALCNQAIGFPAGDTLAAGRERAIWFARSKFPYGIPHSNHTMEGFMMGVGPSLEGRWVFRAGTWYEDLDYAAGYRFVVAPPTGEKSFVWVVFDVVSGAYEFVDRHKDIIKHMYHPHKSVAVLLRFRNLGTGAVGLLCKPIGIDRLGFNWFDSSRYDLHTYSDKFDYSPTIRLVGPSHMDSEASDFRWFNKFAWFPIRSAYKARASWHETKQEQPRVRFFLRDKTTQKISPLSEMAIQGQMFRRLAPIKWLVQKT